MHGLNTLVALNQRQQAAYDARKATAPRYVSYEYSPVREVRDGPFMSVERCEPYEAQFWGVYGRNPDGTASAICDCLDEASADSVVALLNAHLPAMAPAPREYTLRDEVEDIIVTHDVPDASAIERQAVGLAKIVREAIADGVLVDGTPIIPLERR